jgi:RhtB (resistance to homoserine/threonine) family protein
MNDSQLLAFVGVAALLIVTPGADTMLVLRTVLARGKRAGVLATLGICSGLCVHALLSALGLSVILMRSAEAFEIVKWVGAAYLVFLGAQSLLSVARGRHGGHMDVESEAREVGRARSFSEGIIGNLLNPKVALFYLAFVPQFVSAPGNAIGETLTLTTIHLAMSLLWLFMLVILFARVRALLTSPRVRRWLEAATGILLVGLGVRLALERR